MRFGDCRVRWNWNYQVSVMELNIYGFREGYFRRGKNSSFIEHVIQDNLMSDWVFGAGKWVIKYLSLSWLTGSIDTTTFIWITFFSVATPYPNFQANHKVLSKAIKGYEKIACRFCLHTRYCYFSERYIKDERNWRLISQPYSLFDKKFVLFYIMHELNFPGAWLKRCHCRTDTTTVGIFHITWTYLFPLSCEHSNQAIVSSASSHRSYSNLFFGLVGGLN